MIDFASANATRHAMLMDPATQFEGGQPVSVDSLYGIITTTLIGGVRPVFMDFGADGALYVGVYSGSYYRFLNHANAMARVPLRLHRRAGHPGSGPEGDRARDLERGAVQHRQVRRRLLHVGLR